MSRLLFAAARGARIECYSYQHREWRLGDSLIRMHHAPEDYRIHPEDEHLQYGPISSALRAQAEVCPEASCVLGFHIGTVWRLMYSEAMAYEKAGKEHRSLFLLFLAEALADEGM